jgi:hypothetical protein
VAVEAQLSLFAGDVERSLLDTLLSESRLYRNSLDYKDLLDFVVRLRNFAPFNGMLLQIQKPGLSYAASARDWKHRFKRWPKEGARPLIVLRPFGPVALVYDVMDTEGNALPKDVASFVATGSITEEKVGSFIERLKRKQIEWEWVDAGDQRAGSIWVRVPASDKVAGCYRMRVNRNHAPAVQFATVAHELGHLFLGHLGADKELGLPDRPLLSHAQWELEAESLAYLVCARNGVECHSQTYLASYVQEHTTVDHIDLYLLMRAAGQVEAVLGL